MASVRERSVLQLWSDVIFALLIRHLKSKFDDKIGVSWLIIQPLAFVLILSFLRGRTDGEYVHGLPPFVFILLGMASVFQLLQGWSAVSSAISKDKPLYAFRQVQPIASIITAVLVELISFILFMIILYFIAIIFNLMDGIDDPLGIIFYLIEIQFIGYCLGLLFAVFRLFVVEAVKLESLIQRPLLFISGTFFSLNDVPQSSWVYFTWNPLVHGVELARHSAETNFPLVDAVSPIYFHGFVLFLFFFSIASYSVYWKKGIAR